MNLNIPVIGLPFIVHHIFMRVSWPTLGIDETEHSTTFKIFPNPVNKTLIIEKDNSEKEIPETYNVQGQLVKSVLLTQKKPKMEISRLVTGVYIVKIGKEYKKMIKK